MSEFWKQFSPKELSLIKIWEEKMESLDNKIFYKEGNDEINEDVPDISSLVSNILQFEIKKLPKEGHFLTALWVIFLLKFRRAYPVTSLKYPNFQDFLNEYSDGEIKATNLEELNRLWHTANWMSKLFEIIPANKNKGLAILVIPKLLEGWDAKYITGSGQKDVTADRVKIFEHEGNIVPLTRCGKLKTKKANKLKLKKSHNKTFKKSKKTYNPKPKRARIEESPILTTADDLLDAIPTVVLSDKMVVKSPNNSLDPSADTSNTQITSANAMQHDSSVTCSSRYNIRRHKVSVSKPSASHVSIISHNHHDHGRGHRSHSIFSDTMNSNCEQQSHECLTDDEDVSVVHDASHIHKRDFKFSDTTHHVPVFIVKNYHLPQAQETTAIPPNSQLLLTAESSATNKRSDETCASFFDCYSNSMYGFEDFKDDSFPDLFSLDNNVSNNSKAVPSIHEISTSVDNHMNNTSTQTQTQSSFPLPQPINLLSLTNSAACNSQGATNTICMRGKSIGQGLNGVTDGVFTSNSSSTTAADPVLSEDEFLELLSLFRERSVQSIPSLTNSSSTAASVGLPVNDEFSKLLSRNSNGAHRSSSSNSITDAIMQNYNSASNLSNMEKGFLPAKVKFTTATAAAATTATPVSGNNCDKMIPPYKTSDEACSAVPTSAPSATVFIKQQPNTSSTLISGSYSSS